jgi:uncharacterized membrane protein
MPIEWSIVICLLCLLAGYLWGRLHRAEDHQDTIKYNERLVRSNEGLNKEYNEIRWELSDLARKFSIEEYDRIRNEYRFKR